MSGDVSVSLSRFDSVDAITFYSETSPDETLIVVIGSESNEQGGQCGPTLLPHVLKIYLAVVQQRTHVLFQSSETIPIVTSFTILRV